MTDKKMAEIGIIGGSGFYSFFEEAGTPYEEITIDTPYGKPSDAITIGELFGKKVAFIPRHGKNHSFLPHLVNYRANVWALKSLGVKRVISPCAAGSLQNTFFEGPECIHPSAADPYCPELRQIAIEQAKKLGINVHEQGTVVIINGPRFTTKSESKFFTNQGWEVINMSQYPEVHLVRELDMCPITIALITDYDAGLVGDVPPVTHQEVIQVFKSNISRLKGLLLNIIENIPEERNACECYNTSHTS